MFRHPFTTVSKLRGSYGYRSTRSSVSTSDRFVLTAEIINAIVVGVKRLTMYTGESAPIPLFTTKRMVVTFIYPLPVNRISFEQLFYLIDLHPSLVKTAIHWCTHMLSFFFLPSQLFVVGHPEVPPFSYLLSKFALKMIFFWAQPSFFRYSFVYVSRLSSLLGVRDGGTIRHLRFV